jgi:uncharacterized protein
MTFVYFDSSALVKLMLDEPGRDQAVELWDDCHTAFASRLARPEVCAALAAQRRNHDLDSKGFDVAQRIWDLAWATMRPVELSPVVERRAGELTSRHALRGADAVHLASALAIARSDFLMAVWDRRLHAGAVAEGLAVVPASLDAA